MGRFLNRIVTGDGLRRTRFHNYKGEVVDLGGLLYLPHTLLSILGYKLFGFRPAVPWLGWRAIRHLNALIRPDWKILEFGSGMSSIWLAQRCAALISIEADENWYHRVKRSLEERGLSNIDYRLVSVNQYARVDYPDHFFDLVLVDGIERTRCAETALSKTKSGGYIYLDNSDVHWMEYQQAERLLLEAPAVDRATIRYFTDFYPTQLGVNQGLLVALR